MGLCHPQRLEVSWASPFGIYTGLLDEPFSHFDGMDDFTFAFLKLFA